MAFDITLIYMRNRALNYTVGFSLVALVIILFVAYVEQRALSKLKENETYLKLADNLKHNTTITQLRLVEFLTGNKTVSFDNDVMKPLTLFKEKLQAAYDGKETDLGEFKRTDESTRALIKESSINLEKLIKAVEDSKDKYLQVTIAMDSSGQVLPPPAVLPDQQLNQAFENFHGSISKVEFHINAETTQDNSYVAFLAWTSIALMVLAFGLLITVFHRMVRSSEKVVGENTKRLMQQERSVQSLSTFIEAISEGNYTTDVQMEGNDNLGATLIRMRDKLSLTAEEDRKRNWSTSGLAQIGEILRATTKTTEELYDSILKFIVKYTRSNQGGLFLLNQENEGNETLDLVACYAFERKKFLNKTVEIGEGLVGQCFLEGERIYLVEIPSEYVSISSALGGSNPNAILIVPLKVNEKIYGVLELATFGKYEDFEIDLVEKLAESISSTISTVRVNESTRMLLEKTQQQAEEMRAQEEEMRQNMEELEATQEEMRRKEKHIQDLLEGEKQRNDFNQKGRVAVMNLAKDKDVASGNLLKALEIITIEISKHLNVDRVSVSMYDESSGGIKGVKLYNLDKNSYEEGPEILEKNYPLLIKTIRREETIMAADVSMHEALRGYAVDILKPLGIESMLSVPFLNEGKLAGIISCEHLNQYEWTEDHVEFLKSCADLVAVTLNTSKINQTLENLNDAQEMMQTIIDNLPRAVFWKDKELRIQGCNIIFAKVAGFSSPRHLIGKSDFEMPWKEHAATYRADDESVMNSKQARLDQEERNVNSEGVTSWVLTSKVPVMNQHQEVIAVLGMFEDITTRKNKEAEVESKLQELEQLKKLLESRKI